MDRQPDQHEDAIEKTLAALGSSAPPEGMEARIVQRLQHQAMTMPPAKFHWRDIVGGTAFGAAWWRGAFAGAAFATASVAAVLFAMHVARPRTTIQPTTVATERMPAPTRVNVSSPRPESPRTPCIAPTPSVRSASPARQGELMYTASLERSRPIFQHGLTEQERALVQLVQTADPKTLATFTAKAQAADDPAAFEKFFEPPSPPPPLLTQQPLPEQNQ